MDGSWDNRSTTTSSRSSQPSASTPSLGNLKNLLYAFSFIATGGLLFGYIIGINSNVVTPGQLLCDDGFRGPGGTLFSAGYLQCYRLSPILIGLVSSLNLIGACCSSVICFRYADSMGRKLELQVAGSLFLVGACLAAASPTLVGIVLGLFIYGLGIGFAMHGAPVYIAEISPAPIRGTLVSAKEAIVVLGIFLGFVAGYALGGIQTVGWRWMVLIAAVMAVLLLLGISTVPQSPRFLALEAARSRIPEESKALREEAQAALCFFRRATNRQIAEEFEALTKDTLGEPPSSSEDGGADGGSETQSLLHPGTVRRDLGMREAFLYPRPLGIGCGLVFLQQVTGQPSVLYFATNIFKDAGFGESSALQAAVVGLVKLLATLFTVWRVDKYGRRFLLFVGITMMSVALATLGTSFIFTECSLEGVAAVDCAQSDLSLPQGWAIATVVALMVYVIGYQVGFGPISWLLISEIFPLRVRGAAFSIATLVNFASNIATTASQAPLMEAWTPSGLFYAYFVLSLVSLVFVALVVPETKGKSLEEIGAMMMRP